MYIKFTWYDSEGLLFSETNHFSSPKEAYLSLLNFARIAHLSFISFEPPCDTCIKARPNLSVAAVAAVVVLHGGYTSYWCDDQYRLDVALTVPPRSWKDGGPNSPQFPVRISQSTARRLIANGKCIRVGYSKLTPENYYSPAIQCSSFEHLEDLKNHIRFYGCNGWGGKQPAYYYYPEDN